MQLLWLSTISVALALNLEEVMELLLFTPEHDAEQFTILTLLSVFLVNTLQRLRRCLSKSPIWVSVWYRK